MLLLSFGQFWISTARCESNIDSSLTSNNCINCRFNKTGCQSSYTLGGGFNHVFGSSLLGENPIWRDLLGLNTWRLENYMHHGTILFLMSMTQWWSIMYIYERTRTFMVHKWCTQQYHLFRTSQDLSLTSLFLHNLMRLLNEKIWLGCEYQIQIFHVTLSICSLPEGLIKYPSFRQGMCNRTQHHLITVLAGA